MATNGRKRYLHIDENASSEQIYALLDDVESADEDDIDNSGADTAFERSQTDEIVVFPFISISDVFDHSHV